MQSEKNDNRKVLLEIRDVKQYFPVKKTKLREKQRYVRANDGISLTIYEGETLGLVGESGCGKSTFGRTILQLYPQTHGDIIYHKDGKEIDLKKLPPKEMRVLRKDLQLIFQDPYSSLNPRMTVGQIIGEGLTSHGIFKRGDPAMKEYIFQVMEDCGLASYMFNRYPHQFSGGQRQRIGIARSLALQPKFVVCDEAVSALDVSIQSQILNLLSDLREKAGLTYLFITHDLSVVKYISDRIGVMYLGNLVELADAEELFANTLHPYTEALLSAIPTTEEDNGGRERILLEGDIPSPVNPPSGCKFHTRCRYCQEKCMQEVPEWRDMGNNHYIACHFPLKQKKG
ncbi:MAG TPA: ATP-binding cassette domain-containing protein [Candidatus Caccousia avistercoris]|nr:ATP-binding cassette domain-containing protein [Candidatus Caccousia avistercoris]